MSFRKTLYPRLVLVKSRKTRNDMTEKHMATTVCYDLLPRPYFACTSSSGSGES